MHFEGLIIGISTFLIIGIFHPIVIKAEYHFGTRPWWVFLLIGLGGLGMTFFIENTFWSSLIAVFSFSSLWTILELFEQRGRVNKGWFPMNPKRKAEYTPVAGYTYKYPRPALTSDCVIFGKENGTFHILLVQRKNNPFKGEWALPGGFLEMDETAEQCAARELKEETGLDRMELKELCSASTPDRDPRGRTVSIIFYAITDKGLQVPRAGDDAGRAEWFPIENVPETAFDHNEIIKKAIAESGIMK